MDMWSLRQLDWDSEMLGIPSGYLQFSEHRANMVAPDAWRQVVADALSAARRQAMRFLTVKLTAENAFLVNACLAENGLLVDTELTFFKLARKQLVTVPLPEAVSIEKVTPFWDDALHGLAATLRHSRFFRDANIPRASAERLWRESIKNSCMGRASYSIVAFVEGQSAGVINVFERDEVSDIFLLAVLPQYQGRGLGRAMIASYENQISSTISGQTVETQVINYAAQSLYTRVGYRVVGAKHVIHFWL